MGEPHLKQGLRIQVELFSDATKRRYLSRIEDLDQDSVAILFPVPTPDEEEVDIQVGMTCRIAFSIGVGTYAFDAQVADVWPGSPSLFVLPRPQAFYDWKRQHLRVDTSVWVRYTVVPREEMGERIDQPLRSYAETLNVSGGGLLIQVSETLSIGTIVELEIDLPTDLDPVLAIGRVAHISDPGCGVEFLLIDDTDRNRLIKYIFKQERLSRRGKGAQNENRKTGKSET